MHVPINPSLWYVCYYVFYFIDIIYFEYYIQDNQPTEMFVFKASIGEISTLRYVCHIFKE